MAGIICAYPMANTQLILPLLFVNGLVFIYLLVINHLYLQLKAYRFKNRIGLYWYIFWFFFGALACLLNQDSLKSTYFEKSKGQYFKVHVHNEPEQHNGILRFEAKVSHVFIQQKAVPQSGKLLISVQLDTLQPLKLNYGDELIINSKTQTIDPPYNPAEFNFKAWLATKNIYHQCFLNQPQLIKLNTKQGNEILSYAIELRQQQVAVYRRLIKDNEAFAVVATLILGYRSELSAATLAAYSKTGTIHALSVSGMHVGIIYLFLNWVLFFLNRRKALSIFKVILICTLIWYYALLTGYSPSVLRATIMLSVYICAKTFNKSSNNYNIIAFTAFCLLVYDPFLIWDVGFQLSFLAVIGLIYLQPKIYNWFDFRHKWLDRLWSMIALSLAAQLATFPLSIYYFHQFPLYFIFSNLFILLPITVLMYLGIAILVLKLYFMAPIFEWIITFTNNGLQWIAALPFSGISSIWINQWQLMLLSFTLIFFTIALIKYQKSLFIISLCCLFLLQSFRTYDKIVALQQRKILFFSLRKHYAAAFINGRTAILLSDLSSKNSNFDFSIKPALDQLQVNQIHYLSWEKDSKLNNFVKKGNQLSFYDYRILLVDHRLNYKSITNLPQYELLWFHQNPKKEILTLRQEILFDNLVIDESNSKRATEKYIQAAKKLKLEYHVLKKNNSYLVHLK